MKTHYIEKWAKCNFMSSSLRTPEFSRFANDFKKTMTEQLAGTGMEIVSFGIGHFCISGFVRKENKYIYFSISDVRYAKNDWLNNVLFRTAKNDHDFKGGRNRFCKLLECGEKFDELLSSNLDWPSSIE